MKQKINNAKNEVNKYVEVYFNTFKAIAIGFFIYTAIVALSGKKVVLVGNTDSVMKSGVVQVEPLK